MWNYPFCHCCKKSHCEQFKWRGEWRIEWSTHKEGSGEWASQEMRLCCNQQMYIECVWSVGPVFPTEGSETWVPVPAYVERDDKDVITFWLPRILHREWAPRRWGVDDRWTEEGSKWIAGGRVKPPSWEWAQSTGKKIGLRGTQLTASLTLEASRWVILDKSLNSNEPQFLQLWKWGKQYFMGYRDG